mmetsp:Transcript_6492/g.22181  ORF Transcript_6492/g.22181 Transcript_6492/m.22181 type:complete len:108 (+) Transcript_6492:102-425(+)
MVTGSDTRGDGEAAVIAYFDGDVPVFRRTAAHADADEAIGDDAEPRAFAAPSYAAGIPRTISYELEDDEPVYRSLGGLSLSSPAQASTAAPPSLRRQRGFGEPGLCD